MVVISGIDELLPITYCDNILTRLPKVFVITLHIIFTTKLRRHYCRSHVVANRALFEYGYAH